MDSSIEDIYQRMHQHPVQNPVVQCVAGHGVPQQYYPLLSPRNNDLDGWVPQETFLVGISPLWVLFRIMVETSTNIESGEGV